MGVQSFGQDESGIARLAPAGAAAPNLTDQALGLQYCRLGLLSLMRLQLAFERGDRSRVLEPIDELQALDAEVEHLVDALPAVQEDERLISVARRLKSDKMSATFEKLALASGMSGPGLGHGAASLPPSDAAGQSHDAPDEASVWPPAENPARRLIREYAVSGAVMLGILVAVAVLLLSFGS